MTKQNEATARLKINSLLEKAEWRFFDNNYGIANILVENKTLLTKKDFDEFGNDFEKTSNGYLDYLLVDDNKKPLIVIEAKSSKINPLEAQSQAKNYAKSKKVDFVILTNGEINYFWDLKKDEKKVISEFPTLEEFKIQKNDLEEFEKNKKKLLNYAYDEFLIAESQKEGLLRNKEYVKNKDEYCKKNGLIKLRNFQYEALNALRDKISDGKERFLFEMATGTGKTVVAASVIKFFLKSGFTNRVLFLVDRIDLEKQAESDFREYFDGDKVIDIGIYKKKRDNWQNCNILITTIQSLIKDDRFKKYFSKFDFGLIITDEAHRSISGSTNRELFKYFNSYKLGLTATPKAFLKNVDETDLLLTKPLELEERRARDTYSIFGCSNGEATFIYNLKRGIEDKILNKAQLVDNRTLITTKLLSEEGLEFKTIDEQGNEITETFFMKNFEKKFFSEKTNIEICQDFLDNAKCDPVTGEIGKSLFFCVSQNHALKVVNILNKLARKKFSYSNDYEFAQRITSNEDEANINSKLFNHKHNKLNGNSNVEGKYKNYKTSKTRICVTVSMMSTGYNCCDLLNVVMLRPIYSPSEFIQIKGRGTRLYNFEWRNEDGIPNYKSKKKEDFYLFDYFGICEYFEKKYDFKKPEKIIKVAKVAESEGGVSYGESISHKNDRIISSFKKEIGAEGFIVDREAFSKSVDKDKNFKEEFISLYENNKITKAEKYIEEFLKRKDLDYKRLRDFFKIKREVTVIDVYNFFKFNDIKSDEEFFEDKFKEFNSKFNFTNGMKKDVKDFFKEYCFNLRARSLIDRNDIAKLDFHFIDVVNNIKEYKVEIIDYIMENNLYL